LPRLSERGRLATRHQDRPLGSLDQRKIVSQLQVKGIEFKVLDDPSIDTTSRTGKLVMGILALIAEFENDIRRERQTDGIKRAKEQGKKFGRKPVLTLPVIEAVRILRADGTTVPEIMRRTSLSKAASIAPWPSRRMLP
jgi:DNA invertase Pin-like site-specific DNA recombinase